MKLTILKSSKFASIFTFLVAALAASSNALADDISTVKLFDGKSFAGWEGNMDWFRIEEGAIVAGTMEKRIPNNEFLCTKKTYSNFELNLEAKLNGEGKNAGIQFRSKRIPNHHEVIGFQCDMGNMKDRPIWGSLYDESRRRTFLAHGDAQKLSEAYKPNGWNKIKIRCKDNHIQIWVNGFQTVDYTEKDKEIAAEGIIGLQIHSGPPAEASYRNITLTEL